MTYLVYAAWIASLLLAAGELDRLITRGLVNRLFPELRSIALWWLAPVVSMVLPGAGQFMNGQPLKALLSISWPMLIYLIPRPWQHLAMNTVPLLVPWYWLVVCDALLVGLGRDLVHRREDRRLAQPRLTAGQNLSDYLSRRNNQSSEPPER